MTLMNDSTTIGPIRCLIPTQPGLSRVMRLAASGMASLAGFSVEFIDDIKIAVSEVLIALIEHGQGEEVDIEMGIVGRVFSITGSTRAATLDLAHPDLTLCTMVLSEVCVDHHVGMTGQRIEIRASLQSDQIA